MDPRTLAKEAKLSQARLKELLHYDPLTGVFTRRVFANNVATRKVGNINDHGYLVISVDGVKYQAHRVAWLYVTGEWPPDLIDHDDKDRANNRFANLKPCNNSQNQQNQKLHGRNKSGFPGVSFLQRRQLWVAGICVRGKSYNLGEFRTPEAAAEAYAAAKARLHTFHPEPPRSENAGRSAL